MNKTTATVFLDMVLSVCMMLTVMFILAMVQMNPSKKNGDIDLKAELTVSMEWDGNSDSDVDLLVHSPAGLTFYGNRDNKGVSLERDDLGTMSDRIQLADGSTEVIKDNWERTTVRKLTPGSYDISVLMYKKRDALPQKVKIKVEALNPYRVIAVKEVELTVDSEEIPIISFGVAPGGKIIDIIPGFRRLSRQTQEFK